jgi:hypothetical protein
VHLGIFSYRLSVLNIAEVVPLLRVQRDISNGHNCENYDC